MRRSLTVTAPPDGVPQAVLPGASTVAVHDPTKLPMPTPDLAEFFAAEGPRTAWGVTVAAPVYNDLRKDERVAVAAALRATGLKPTRIAQLLHCSVHTVRDYLVLARECGALDDVVRDLDMRHVPRAVENLGKLLDKGDVKVTLEVLRGRGLLRTFGNTKHEGASPTAAMQFNVTFTGAPLEPTPGPLVVVPHSTGEIVGAPNE